MSRRTQSSDSHTRAEPRSRDAYKLKARLRALLRKSKMERELDEELRYHIEQQTEQNIRLG